MKVQVSNTNAPQWRDIMVKSNLPAGLEGLQRLARNLWWSWNHDARELFRELDLEQWRAVGHNPVALLETLSYDKLQEVAADKAYMARVKAVIGEFDAYMAEPKDTKRSSVAYFSMEYGLTACLKI